MKRLDTRILRSVVLVIGEQGTIQKTPLMARTKLDYPRLNLYLNWLELIGLVKTAGQIISLTENGISFRIRCLDLIKA